MRYFFRYLAAFICTRCLWAAFRQPRRHPQPCPKHALSSDSAHGNTALGFLLGMLAFPFVAGLVLVSLATLLHW